MKTWNLESNPILLKQIRTRFRKGQFFGAATIIAVLALGATSLLVASRAPPDAGVYLGLGALPLVLLLVGNNQVHLAVRGSITSGMIDFHRISPTPASQLAFGFVFGGAIRELALAAMLALIPMGFAIACGKLLPTMLVILAVFLNAFMWYSVTAAASMNPGTGNRRPGGMLVFGFYILSFITGFQFGFEYFTFIPAWSAFTDNELTKMFGRNRLVPMGQLLGLDVSNAIVLAFHQLPVFVFSMLAFTRKLGLTTRPYFSKWQLIAIAATVSAVTALDFGHLDPVTTMAGGPAGSGIAVGVSALVLLALFCGHTPTADRWRRGRARQALLGRPFSWSMDEAMILTSAVVGLAAIAIPAVIVRLLGAILTRPGLFLETIANGDLLSLLRPFGSLGVGLLASGIFLLGHTLALQYFRLRFGAGAVAASILFVMLLWVIPLFVSGGIALAGGTDIAIYAPLSISPPAVLGSGAALVGYGYVTMVPLGVNLAIIVIFGSLLAQTYAKVAATPVELFTPPVPPALNAPESPDGASAHHGRRVHDHPARTNQP
jgi:hypothetical protein